MKNLKMTAFVLWLVFIVAFLPATDQSEEQRVYRAAHVNPHPPVIDGKIDDPAWNKVPWSGDFIQREPEEGRQPSQKTAFKILYDDQHIYIAIRAFDDQPDKIVRRVSRRDALDGDVLSISLDSYFDRRCAFIFRVSAAGVKADEFMSNDGGSRDVSWDAVWYAKTAIDEQGWSAELKIPFSQLRFSGSDEQTWGLQVDRWLERKQERSVWQSIPREASGWVHRFGLLQGLTGIKSARRIELMPYAVGKAHTYQAQTDNPYAPGSSFNGLGGLDGKIGLSSNLTLDFTLNPDFGQVEADPSEINLTAFESYFTEKRPFFIEGRNIFNFNLMDGDGDFSMDNLFYSRRIGRTPQFHPQPGSGEYLDMPENVPIIGAFKLSGKTGKGLSIGVINATTAQSSATIGNFQQERSEIVEPLTNFLVLRLQKDANQGNTIFGAMATATHRDISAEHLSFLHHSAYSAGFDLSHAWNKKAYRVLLRTVFSHVQGSEQSISRTQQAPQRYYQRPDAEHLELNEELTSLSGHGGTLALAKTGNSPWRFSGGFTWRSPGLELNDAGFLRESDLMMQWLWSGYNFWKPFFIFRNLSINVNQWQGWNFAGENVFQGGNLNLGFQLKNFWRISLGINRQGDGLSKSALRGGPALRTLGGWNSWYYLASDERKKLQFSLNGSEFRGDQQSISFSNLRFGLIYRPNNAVLFSMHPFFSEGKRTLQYVATRDFNQDKRYIFASMDQKTIALITRLNLNLTPELSIQFYGQPFISSGHYRDFKHITAPRHGSYYQRFRLFESSEISYDQSAEMYSVHESGKSQADYSFGNPNFNFLQFRANLVVRWEYSPGSVLFLVWSQGRSNWLINGELGFIDGMSDLFALPAQNVFLIKFSHRFRL